MKVSVITVCLNAENLIEETIQSVISQSFTNVEYLVIDGNSSDKTVTIINKYTDNIDYFISERDSGIYNAMNKGILAATGEFIYFLNAGDLFYNKTVIENFICQYAALKGDFFYGNVLLRKQGNEGSFFKDHHDIDKSFFLNNVICQQAIFYKSSFFTPGKCGLFDERLRVAADYEWLLRALFKYKLMPRFIDMPVAVYPLGGLSDDKKMAHIIQEERQQALSNYFNDFEIMIICHKWFKGIYKVKLFKIIIRKIMDWNLS